MFELLLIGVLVYGIAMPFVVIIRGLTTDRTRYVEPWYHRFQRRK